MQKVTILDKELNLGYNMQTACFFERATGKSALDSDTFQQGSPERQMEMAMMMGYACLITSNMPEQVPEFDQLMQSFHSFQEASDFIAIAMKEMQEFFMPDKTDTADTEESEKNA